MTHHCVDGSEISPRPWKVVPYHIPYFTWIMAADGGIVCMGFGASDERLLLHAGEMRAVLERLVAWMVDGPDSGATLTEIGDEARALLAATT